MATVNPFDILGDDDNDDLSQLIAKQEKKIQSKKAATPAAAPAPAAPATSKFLSKPSPPTQAGLTLFLLRTSFLVVYYSIFLVNMLNLNFRKVSMVIYRREIWVVGVILLLAVKKCKLQ
jgi:Stm1